MNNHCRFANTVDVTRDRCSDLSYRFFGKQFPNGSGNVSDRNSEALTRCFWHHFVRLHLERLKTYSVHHVLSSSLLPLLSQDVHIVRQATEVCHVSTIVPAEISNFTFHVANEIVAYLDPSTQLLAIGGSLPSGNIHLYHLMLRSFSICELYQICLTYLLK